jgi:hypothetical protein
MKLLSTVFLTVLTLIGCEFNSNESLIIVYNDELEVNESDLSLEGVYDFGFNSYNNYGKLTEEFHWEHGASTLLTQKELFEKTYRFEDK